MAIALPIVVPLDVLFVVNEVTSMFSPTKRTSATPLIKLLIRCAATFSTLGV